MLALELLKLVEMNNLSRQKKSELSIGNLIKNLLRKLFFTSPGSPIYVSFLWSNFTNVSSFPDIFTLICYD